MKQKIPSEREIEILRLVVTERNGREIAKLYEQEAGSRIPYGTVYTLLAAMAARKWVRTTETTECDRRVRRFKLTRGGAAALNSALEHHTHLSGLAADALDRVKPS